MLRRPVEVAVKSGRTFLKEANLFLTLSFPFPIFVDGAGGVPKDFVFAQGAGDPSAEYEKSVGQAIDEGDGLRSHFIVPTEADHNAFTSPAYGAALVQKRVHRRTPRQDETV